MATAISDRIERKIELNATRERVWKAITTEAEFARWFGIKVLEGSFRPGAKVRASSTHRGYEHVVFYFHIEKMEAPRLFSWRWIPGAKQPANEPTTLVEFALEETNDGASVTITETGFDRLSLEYRAAAFKDNTGGWEHQAKSLANYLAQNS
jgi:uncharacterized protein YndB with AHSA1/START domain